ncbi:MAG: hypothetical protein VXY85_00080 [Actinomycetota bacterium]|nr:hypothetical protein [Actinomycetota bacterium]
MAADQSSDAERAIQLLTHQHPRRGGANLHPAVTNRQLVSASSTLRGESPTRAIGQASV